jgi:hypothetical protein
MLLILLFAVDQPDVRGWWLYIFRELRVRMRADVMFFSSMARVQFHRSAPLLDAFDTAIYG